MAFSEKTYQALLVVYPQDHRQACGESMTQLFRDRMHRDGGGFGTAVVWSQMGLDLASSATKERMETIMEVKSWTKQWWEILVVLLGVNSLVVGFGFLVSGYADVAILVRFAPGALLLVGLALRRTNRAAATVLIILGSIGAGLAYWVIYTVVFALIIVVGGFQKGKIGFQGSGPEIAV